ncbi:MAG TPA: prepilin peptidase [Clostridiales bacterium]|nr:prepilin peptidase [Clostridiales bacterium]
MISAILKQPYLDTGFYIVVYTIITFLGITIGSFLNVCIYRIPNNDSIVKHSSHCMSCNTKIRRFDLIPVISWLILRGKCRNCNARISPRYPIIEALNAILYIITLTVMDININSILTCIFFSILIVIAFIDIDTLEMDIYLLLLIAILSIPAAIFTNDLTIWQRISGALYVGLPFFLIGEISGYVIKKQTGEKMRGIELGDTILMACTGLFIGHEAIIVSAFAGIMFAAIGGIISKAITKESKLPFGPYLALGIVVGTFFGEQIINWYVGMFFTY